MNAWLSARETVSSGVPPSANSADRLESKGVWRLVREGNGLGHRQATGHRVKHFVGQRVEPSHWQAALPKGGDADVALTAVTAPTVAPVPPGRVTNARRVTAVTAGTMITAVTARAMWIPTVTAVTAVTAGPCPPSERHAVAG